MISLFKRSPYKLGNDSPSFKLLRPASDPVYAGMSDLFDGSSLDPKWTWINQLTGTATVSGGNCTLTRANAASISFLSQPIPDPSNFSYSCKFSIGTIYGGMAVHNSANTRQCWALAHVSNQDYFQRVQTYVTSSNQGTPWNATGVRYYRIKSSGTNVLFESSTDGSSWTTRRTEPLASWLSTVSHIALAVLGSGSTASIAYDYFQDDSDPL